MKQRLKERRCCARGPSRRTVCGIASCDRGMPMNVANLNAIEVLVHAEHMGDAVAADTAASKVFAQSGALRDAASLAADYCAYKNGCIVFPVDGRLTGG